MSKIWKVAVIGAGDMGKSHVSGWKMAGHQVVSITDIDQERAGQIAKEFDVPQTYADYKEAIGQPDVEIVSICLPLSFHAPVTIYAAEQGKHVFCEKPLARNFQEADAMEEAVNKAGVQFGIGFQRNLSRSIWTVRDWIEEGRLGRPVISQCDSVAQIRPKRIMHDANGNAGPLMDLGCHYFIMWQTMFQSLPKTIYARGEIMARDRQELAHIEKLAVDSAVVTIEYESGDIGIFTVTWGMAPNFKMKAYQDRLFGPKGGVEGNLNGNPGKVTLYEEDQVSEVPLEKYKSLHQEQFDRFVDALNTGKAAPTSFKEARDVLATTLAIFKSIETGEVIDFASFYKQLV